MILFLEKIFYWKKSSIVCNITLENSPVLSAGEKSLVLLAGRGFPYERFSDPSF